MHIVALTTCHNRRDVTLASLSDLYLQDIPTDVSFSITIVDDGSKDGTTEAVREIYPEVEIINGDGNLYWAGGMREGWERSVKHKKYDALLVFNDDVHLEENALRELIETSYFVRDNHDARHVVTGAFIDSSSKEITYGGYRQSSKWHPLRFTFVAPTGEPCQVDTLNMNFALISIEALNAVGFLSSYFRHGGADMEYGLKLRKLGGSVWLSPSIVGKCNRNITEYAIIEKSLSPIEKFRLMTCDKGESPSIRARYFHEHGGLFWPVLWAGPYLRILIGAINVLLCRKFR